MFYEKYKFTIILVLSSLIFFEILWSRRSKSAVYNRQDSLTNSVILLGNQLSKLVFLGWTVWVLDTSALFQIGSVQLHWSNALLALVVIDFFYYWQHRLLHQIKILWALHEVHHSSPWFNLSSSFRLNWMAPLVTPFFYIPVVMLGFQTEHVLTFFSLNLLYQFWLHTQSVPPILAIEGWLNTPSAHRVHHGSNPYCIDKNFGGVLMIWDRLFGSYAAENETVVYGVTTGFQGHNPLKLVFLPLWRVLRGQQSLERQNVLLKPEDQSELKPTQDMFQTEHPTTKISELYL